MRQEEYNAIWWLSELFVDSRGQRDFRLGSCLIRLFYLMAVCCSFSSLLPQMCLFSPCLPFPVPFWSLDEILCPLQPVCQKRDNESPGSIFCWLGGLGMCLQGRSEVCLKPIKNRFRCCKRCMRQLLWKRGRRWTVFSAGRCFLLTTEHKNLNHVKGLLNMQPILSRFPYKHQKARSR